MFLKTTKNNWTKPISHLQTCWYVSLHNCPFRIKKSYCFLILNEKSQRKPLLSHKTDIRIKKSPDFLILTWELLLTRDLNYRIREVWKRNIVQITCYERLKGKTASVLPFNIRFTEYHWHFLTLLSARGAETAKVYPNHNPADKDKISKFEGAETAKV